MRGLDDLRGYQQRLVTRLYEHDVTAAVVPMGGGGVGSVGGGGVSRH